MSKIVAYVKLRYKLLFSRDKSKDKGSGVITALLAVATVCVVAFLINYLFDIISFQFLDEITPREFMVLIYSILGIVMIIVAVTKELKIFLFQNDFLIEARFPISTVQMFVAQLIMVYVDILVLSVAISTPVAILFGISAEVCSVAFVFLSILSAFLLPLVPFAVSLLFTVPIMFVLNLLENKNVLKLIIFLIVLVALFVLYSILLNFLADYYISKRIDATAKVNFTSFVLAFDNGWNFFSYLANVNFGEKVAVSLLVLFSVFLCLFTIEVLVALPVYERARENILEGKKKILSKNGGVTKDMAFWAIFKKDFKEIVRTDVYAYFYLGIAILTPVMVFLTNEIIRKIGSAQLGGDVSFGVSVIVVYAFISMINSFSGSTLSREGRQFYVTKISPVDYRKQLFSKGLLNGVISMTAIIMSVVILCVMKFVTVGFGMFLLLISLLFSLGSVFNGLNVSVRSPSVTDKTGGQESQTNSLVTMFIGLIICFLSGCVSIILGFFLDTAYVFLILLGISLVYALINVLVFIFTVNKKYSNIE